MCLFRSKIASLHVVNAVPQQQALVSPLGERAAAAASALSYRSVGGAVRQYGASASQLPNRRSPHGINKACA